MAPNKNKLSIPKKELSAILLGCNKANYLAKILNLPKENIIIHSDSLLSIIWIKQNPDKLKVYVSNRVRKIQAYNNILLHVSGIMNPADYVTKISATSKYVNNPIWQNGPSFLKEGNDKLMAAYQVEEIQKDQLAKEDDEAISAEIKTKLRTIITVQKIKQHC